MFGSAVLVAWDFGFLSETEKLFYESVGVSVWLCDDLGTFLFSLHARTHARTLRPMIFFSPLRKSDSVATNPILMGKRRLFESLGNHELCWGFSN